MIFIFALCLHQAIAVTGLLPEYLEDLIGQSVHNGTAGVRLPGIHMPGVHLHLDALVGHSPSISPLQIQSEREREIFSAQQQVMVSQERQESLNRRLRSGQYTDEFLEDYALTSASQTNAIVSTVNSVTRPYTGALSHAIDNFLLTPYMFSVTSGAVLYNIALSRASAKAYSDLESVQAIHKLTDAYTNLVEVGHRSQLNYGNLQQTTQNIVSHITGHANAGRP